MIPPQKIQLYVWLEFWFTVFYCWNSWWETFCTPGSSCIQSVPFLFFSPLTLKHPQSTTGWILPLKYYFAGCLKSHKKAKKILKKKHYFAIIFVSCPLIQIIMFEQWLVAQYEFGMPVRFKELIIIKLYAKYLSFTIVLLLRNEISPHYLLKFVIDTYSF